MQQACVLQIHTHKYELEQVGRPTHMSARNMAPSMREGAQSMQAVEMEALISAPSKVSRKRDLPPRVLVDVPAADATTTAGERRDTLATRSLASTHMYAPRLQMGQG
eukprot:CAMPEP_0178390476 /NCGR_PEP_ID=MMETSP0689_2-20121128/10666_1 /TAXON_ID=160604 /ORGANISM="Amphidinium massartii, Strain CS-259" /LENGTH=106 /DNA_ID=CAMNT_0020010987 /DNA_START=109 /DNA_END=428 /DNA_ORIENTATION=-